MIGCVDILLDFPFSTVKFCNGAVVDCSDCFRVEPSRQGFVVRRNGVMIDYRQNSPALWLEIFTMMQSFHITDLQFECKMEGIITTVTPHTITVARVVISIDDSAVSLVDPKYVEIEKGGADDGLGLEEEERVVKEIDSKTGASLKLTILNREGRIWTLTAGGGASVIYADTICDFGYNSELGLYGEYSGDPNEEDTYAYTMQVLKLVVASKAADKVLLIGGGIANFTDVAKTFAGIKRGIDFYGTQLKEEGTKVWIRRGGPNYVIGLENLKKACEGFGIPCRVYGPEGDLTCIVREALGGKKREGGGSGGGDGGSGVISSSKVEDCLDLKEYDIAVPLLSPPIPPISSNTTCIIYCLQAKTIQRMLDFDSLCGRKGPSILAIVDPTGEDTFERFLFGVSDILLPVYRSLETATRKHPAASIMINFSSFRSVLSSTLEALAIPLSPLTTHVIVAEGVPEMDEIKLVSEARKKGVSILGPGTVGGISPGRLRLSNAGGSIENLTQSKLYRAGSVAFVTKSGGLLNELNSIISRVADGVYEGMALGGDRFSGLRFIDLVTRYEAIESVKLICMVGEVGGVEELLVANAIREGKIKKPVVAWCTGTSAEHLRESMHFAHAGAVARSRFETATFKNAALRNAGAHVPLTFDEFSSMIGTVWNDLLQSGKACAVKEPPTVPKLPEDFDTLKKKGLVRRSSQFVCSISDDRGHELRYNKVGISTVKSIGQVVSLLWLKKDLPDYALKFFELCLVVMADHGPAVSGAHCTIVAARAGKDLVSSLISGLATIGPRFGGALDDAALMFLKAVTSNVTAQEFVNKCKADKKLIMGIGHKVKTIHNPDVRVQIITNYAKEHFRNTNLLQFAREVEAITTMKRPNLILNVDGAVACCLVDCFMSAGCFTREEIDVRIKNGLLNGFFVAARTFGLIGHYLDQRSLQQPLYRVPYDDIFYYDQ